MLSIFNLENGSKGRELNFKNYIENSLNLNEPIPPYFSYKSNIGDVEIKNEGEMGNYLKFNRIHKKRYIKDVKKIKYYEMGNTSKDERHDCHIKYNPYKCKSQSNWGNSSYDDRAKYRYEKVYAYSIHSFIFAGSKLPDHDNIFYGNFEQSSKRDNKFYGERKTGNIHAVIFKDEKFESKEGYTKKYHHRYLLFFYKSKEDALDKKNPIDYFELYYQHTKYPPASIWLILSIIVLILMFIMGTRAFAMLRNRCEMNWFEFLFGRCGGVIVASR